MSQDISSGIIKLGIQVNHFGSKIALLCTLVSKIPRLNFRFPSNPANSTSRIGYGTRRRNLREKAPRDHLGLGYLRCPRRCRASARGVAPPYRSSYHNRGLLLLAPSRRHPRFNVGGPNLTRN